MKKIQTTEQVEKALYQIAELDLQISDADNDAKEMINRAKAQAEEATRELTEQRAELVALLSDYSADNRDAIYEDGQKSRKYTNGTIGYRQNPDKIEVSKTTAELLEKAGFSHCVKIKKEPVKPALKGFSDAQLKKVKAQRVPGIESFYVKASEDCVKTRNAA